MTTRARRWDPERSWRRLREDPDYVSDWRASAGPTVCEAPPYAFRRQTEADIEAARWKLLAWENPRHPQWAELFRADVAMVEVRVVVSGAHARRCLLRRAGATFTGLRLLDGALVLKVSRGRETGQIRVLDGAGTQGTGPAANRPPPHRGFTHASRGPGDGRSRPARATARGSAPALYRGPARHSTAACRSSVSGAGGPGAPRMRAWAGSATADAGAAALGTPAAMTPPSRGASATPAR